MAPIGQTAFTLLVWGALVGVVSVFVYEVYVLGRDAGWID